MLYNIGFGGDLYGWVGTGTGALEACGTSGSSTVIWVVKGLGNTSTTSLQNGDQLYTSSGKSTKFGTPGSSTNHFYVFTVSGTRYHFLLGNMNSSTPDPSGGFLSPGEVASVAQCAAAPTPTRTPTRTRTRSVSTSTSGGTCQALNLAYDRFTSGGACNKFPNTSLFYGDGAFQNGTRLYLNSTCTSNSNTGWYANGFVAFQKTSTGGGLTNGSICGFSDRRLKMNIKLIGVSTSGIKIYTFEYIDKAKYGEGVYQGVMSDEIPQEAVIKTESGYDMVDYNKLDVEFKRIK